MPLSEADREILGNTESERRELPLPASLSLAWIDSIYGLWSQRRQIARWAVLGFIVSCVVAWFYPKYESTTQIMPPDGGGSGLASLLPAALSKSPGLIGLAGDMMGVKSTGAIFAKVLDSRTVQDDLIKNFELQKRYHQKYLEDTRKILAQRTAIAEDKKSGVISITVKDSDRDVARKLADAYVVELGSVMTNVSTSAARRERIFIEQRLVDENKNLQNAEQQFSQFASTNMAFDVPEQTKVTVEAAARLQGELIASQAQLEGLKQTYTEENIRVKSAQAHVNELQRSLAKINSGSTSGVQNPVTPYPSVKSLPLLGVKWADLYRNTKIRETVVELLTQQYEMARIQEAKEIPGVKVLDPASDPEKRKPSWKMTILIGTLVGLVLACIGYLLKNWWDNWDHDDPRRMLIAHAFHGGIRRMGSARQVLRQSRKPEETSQA